MGCSSRSKVKPCPRKVTLLHGEWPVHFLKSSVWKKSQLFCQVFGFLNRRMLGIHSDCVCTPQKTEQCSQKVTFYTFVTEWRLNVQNQSIYSLERSLKPGGQSPHCSHTAIESDKDYNPIWIFIGGCRNKRGYTTYTNTRREGLVIRFEV